MTQLPKDYQAYLASLPIAREPDSSQLTAAEIAQISQIVFATPNPQPADLLFVFGTSTLHAQILGQIADYFQRGFYPWMLVTGLLGRAYYETGKPVAHYLRDNFIASGIPADKILVQDRSTNTLEDATFSLEVLEKAQIAPQTIAFLSKSYHSGRCLLTMRKVFPSQPLFPITYDPQIDGVTVSAENWAAHPVSRGRTYGEYLRIRQYAARGDIAPIGSS